jgi:chorismate synthase
MLRFLTAGESHGPQLTAIIDGFPAGLPLSPDDLHVDLARRQKAYGAGGRMAIEKDLVRFTGGVMGGQTTGGPITMVIENKDWQNWAEKDIPPMTIPRPGHADLTGALKYGYRDLRVALERSSARETAARVAVGALCKQLLHRCDIQVGSYITAIGSIAAHIPDEMEYPARFAAAEADETGTRCPLPEVAQAMREHIYQCMQARNTLGGVIETVALGVPAGLGSYVQWDRRLEARIVGAICSIPAIKGAEVGDAFLMATKHGTEVHDEIVLGNDSTLTRASNHAGGFEGGITTGLPIVIRAAMKPINTILAGMQSVDLATGETSPTQYERSDISAAPRAGVVCEAMMSFVLADALLEKVGGDSLDEIVPRVEGLRRGRLEELPMDNIPWRFGYE